MTKHIHVHVGTKDAFSPEESERAKAGTGVMDDDLAALHPTLSKVI